MRSGTYLDPQLEKSARRIDRRLAQASEPAGGRCAMPGCRRPTQTSAGSGFSPTHCRYHTDLKSRHGSYWRKTYTGAELRPYRKAAQRYLKGLQAAEDKELAAALQGLSWLMAMGGRRIPVPDLPGKSMETKARAALWRLSEAHVPPLALLVDHLAISAATWDAFAGGEEYRIVQIAKACLRKASSYRPGYEWAPDRVHYTPSRGLFLRVLGEKLEAVCGAFTASHADAIRAAVRLRRLASVDPTKPIK